MYKTLLLLLFSVMAMVDGRSSSGIPECDMKTIFIKNCEAYKVSPPNRNQECRANNILSLPNTSFFFKTGTIFEFMEVAITTRRPVQPTLLKMEGYMFDDVLTWYHIELREEKHANGYTYSVYVDGAFKKRNTSADELTDVTVYFKGYPSYAPDCNPDSDVLLNKPSQPTPPASQPSTEPWITAIPDPPATGNSTSQEHQDEEEGFSLIFIISVSAGMVGAVLLVIIAAQCYIFHKNLKSKGGEAQDAQKNETEVISFLTSRQLPSPPNHLPLDPMENDPEKHIYWEVSDLGPVTSVGGGCDDRRGSAHESINSLYATFDYYMEDDQ